MEREKEPRRVGSAKVSRVEYKYSRIIKSPCSAFCSSSLGTGHRKRLTTELCIANRESARVRVHVRVRVCPWPLITSLRDLARHRLVLCAPSPAAHC